MTSLYTINIKTLALLACVPSNGDEIGFSTAEELNALPLTKLDLVEVYNKWSGKPIIKNFKSREEAIRRTFPVIEAAYTLEGPTARETEETPETKTPQKFSILRDFATAYKGGVSSLPFVPANSRQYRVNPLPYIFG